jgi:hypothetical protein
MFILLFLNIFYILMHYIKNKFYKIKKYYFNIFKKNSKNNLNHRETPLDTETSSHAKI